MFASARLGRTLLAWLLVLGLLVPGDAGRMTGIARGAARFVYGE